MAKRTALQPEKASVLHPRGVCCLGDDGLVASTRQAPGTRLTRVHVGPQDVRRRRRALEAFLQGVRNDVEYQYSDEAVDESITCNGYEFTENGERF